MMSDAKRSWLGVVFFLFALCSLVFFRPVLRTVGIDLDRTVPDWADFFSPSQYDAFLREVNGYFQARGLDARIQDGTLYAEDGGEYGLRTLAQKCLQLRRDAWADTIKRQFERTRAENGKIKPPAAQPKANSGGDGL